VSAELSISGSHRRHEHGVSVSARHYDVTRSTVRDATSLLCSSAPGLGQFSLQIHCAITRWASQRTSEHL